VARSSFEVELDRWGVVEMPRDLADFSVVVGMTAFTVAKTSAPVRRGYLKGNLRAWKGNSVNVTFDRGKIDASPVGARGSGAEDALATLRGLRRGEAWGLVSPAPYSAFQELGTAAHGARPYMRPAAEAANRLVVRQGELSGIIGGARWS
jgi:hypothetical protein